MRVRMLVFRDYDRDPRVWREADAVAQAGARVEIYMLRRASQPEVSELAHGVRVFRTTSIRPDTKKPWQAVKGYSAFWRGVGRDRADVYHCHDGATLPVGLRLARRDGAKLLYDAHEYFSDYAPAPPGESFVDLIRRRWLPDYVWERLLIRRPDRCLTVTDRIARLMRETYRLAETPAFVRNSAPYWAPTAEHQARLRRSIGAAESEVIITFLGSGQNQDRYALESDWQRGLGVVMDALPAGARLAVIQEAGPEYERGVRERAERSGHSAQVSCVRPEDYDDYLELASGGDIGVYLMTEPSTNRAEAMPNRLFDFVMARLPLVVGPGTAMTRVVEEYKIGAVADSVKPDAVGEAIGRIMPATGQAAQLAENLEHAARDLCWETESRRLLDVYAAFINGDRASA